ncbi:hypothetical protein AB0L70_35755 [Kribbella sp. NPDC051952]|uniref:hypothetical protein n=1 Tax=Kribbella sp. NPDC051952 TaxID=3154851 RepID=UPI003440F644
MYYDKVGDAAGQTEARQAAWADDQARLAVLREFYGTLAGTVSGGTTMGLAKTALTKLLDEGLTLPQPAPVLPGKVPTGADATGVLVAQARGAHDFAEARLRSGPANLPSELFTAGANGHPQLKELATMTGQQRTMLRTWALNNGGERYVTAYGSLFFDTYSQSEKIDDGQAVMNDFTDNPSQ